MLRCQSVVSLFVKGMWTGREEEKGWWRNSRDRRTVFATASGVGCVDVEKHNRLTGDFLGEKGVCRSVSFARPNKSRFLVRTERVMPWNASELLAHCERCLSAISDCPD